MTDWSDTKKWVLGIVGALIVALGSLIFGVFFRGSSDSDLRIVDVTTHWLHFDLTEVDITMRNVGSSPAVIKSIELRVTDAVFLESCSLCPGAPVRTSATYDMSLGFGRQQSVEKQVAFSVPPRGEDRFALRVHVPYPQGPEFSVYRANLRIVSDEDNKETHTDHFHLASGNYGWAIQDLEFEPEGWDHRSGPPSVYFSCNREVVNCVERNQALLSRIGYEHTE